MSDIFEAMMQMENERPSERPAPLPEAIVARMREAAERYMGPCQFGVGDVITARGGSLVSGRNVGVPYLVLAIDDGLGFIWTGEYGAPDLGARVNMRVLSYHRSDDSIVPRWVDSADFELFSEYQARQSGGDNGAAI